MRVLSPAVAVLVTLFGLVAGCVQDSEWPAVCQGEIQSTGGATTILEPALDVVEINTITAGQPGSPCEVNADCITNYCMTTELISTLIPGTTVTKGYCSELMCAVDGSTGLCGTEDVGGICFSLYPFVPSMGASGICLAPCEQDADCRPEDDVICFDAQTLVDLELLSQELLDQYYPNATAGCLSRSIAEAAKEKLQEQ